MAYPTLRTPTSNATTTPATSIVCTHPTGLTAGDLMTLFVGTLNYSDDHSISTPSGWTVIEYQQINSSQLNFAGYEKIATAGDVSAGSTTVSIVNGTPNILAYAMLAFSGTATGSEVTPHESETQTLNSTSMTTSLALTPITSESILVTAFYISEDTLSAAITASSFSLTPTTTMTERVDVGVRNGSSDGVSILIATGNYAGTTEITASSVTYSESLTTGGGMAITFLVNPQVNATGTNATFAVSPLLSTQNGVAGTVGTNTLLAVSPNLPTQSGVGTVPTVWTPVNKT